MADKPVIVYGRFKAKPGKEDELRQSLIDLIAPTRQEAGCISYEMHQQPQDAAQFMSYEIWRSQTDIDQHMQTPYVAAVVARAEEMIELPFELSIWEKLD
jgi:quinol monooxygenase YgiN